VLARGYRFALKQGMHARLVLLSVITVIGCARDNPAFEGSTGTETSTSSMSADTNTDTADMEAESSADGQPLMCELGGGQPMMIELAPQCAQDDLEAYDRWFNVLAVEGSTWWVGACTDPNCGGCQDQTQLPLSFAPIPVGDLAGPERCLRVMARRRDPANPDSCSYGTVVVSDYTDSDVGVPILIARNDSTIAFPVIEPAAGPMLSGFDPKFMPADTCPCADYPDDCCDGQDPAPTVFDLEIATGNTVEVGQTGPVTLDTIEYEFWALDAFDTGQCDEPRHVSWALTRN
jgi:hypothetical protein